LNVRTFFVGALLVAGALPLVAPVLLPPAAVRGARTVPTVEPDAMRVDWPTHFRDQPLTQQPLSTLEQRFAQRFPGAIARFSDGARTLVLREVGRPTRQMHPAADCFRAAGYAIDRPQPFVDDQGETWSCFTARRDGAGLRVCEAIVDRDGRRWTDVSAWFWASQYGGGPWRAITVIEPMVGPH
jgi:hypothetical protein